MSHQNENNSTDMNEIRAIFSEAAHIEDLSSPYLATRVLAQVASKNRESKRLLFWKVLSGFSLSVSLGLALFISQRPASNGIANVAQAYVIHVDFNQDDSLRVAQAEVELPEGVHFSSNRPEVRALRSMKIPFKVNAEGKYKLPFVVASDLTGTQVLKVRLFDLENNLVKSKEMKIKFAKQNQGNQIL